MWMLLLNDMRWPKREQLGPVCRAETREDLERFLGRETVEPWTDVGPVESAHRSAALALARGYEPRDPRDGRCWAKVFRRGGPLEWYNPPRPGSVIDVGSEEDWAEVARSNFRNCVLSICSVEDLERPSPR